MISRYTIHVWRRFHGAWETPTICSSCRQQEAIIPYHDPSPLHPVTLETDIQLYYRMPAHITPQQQAAGITVNSRFQHLMQRRHILDMLGVHDLKEALQWASQQLADPHLDQVLPFVDTKRPAYIKYIHGRHISQDLVLILRPSYEGLRYSPPRVMLVTWYTPGSLWLDIKRVYGWSLDLSTFNTISVVR